MGVCERVEMRFQTLEKGSKSSRARAKMVRLPAWMPGSATRFMTIKPQSVNRIAGARPMALKKSCATCFETEHSDGVFVAWEDIQVARSGF